jgi:V8-like Glu-specific endopeptidase/uncharacterized protein YjbI with pentapeptide repeats
MRKFYILSLIFVFGFAFCLTNGFAEENKNGEHLEEINVAGDLIKDGRFEFPTPDGAAYIQGTPEFQKALENIIGSNDFEKMRDLPPESQDYILGTKVGMIFIPNRFDPNRGYFCTGFLVGPDLFMTNHHCIHDDLGRLSLQGIEIYMNYYQDYDADPTLGGVTAGVAEVLKADALKDYALLRLNKPIGDTYGWLELDTTTRADSSQSVKMISHNQGRSKEIVRRNTEIVDIPAGHPWEDVPFALLYLADSEGGSSGSPVFLRDGTGVIGIHHSAWTFRGEPVFNGGSLISYIVPEIQQWLPGGTPTPPTPPPTPTGDLVYWSDVGMDKIQRASLDGSNIQDLVRRVKAYGITVDVQGGKMYWTNDFGGGKIQRGNLDGSNIEDLVTTGLIDLADIELDIAAGKMYWTDFEAGKIQRANLNGSNVEDLITGLESPNNIALDVAGGKMYWTDNNADKIQRANLDGSNVRDLITEGTGLSSPVGIALDVSGGKMYWVDTGAAKIRRANLDGSNIQDIITGLDLPNCIALDVAGGKMYWTEFGIGKIQRANLDGSNIQDIITGLNSTRDITLGIPSTTRPPSPTIAFTPPTIADQEFPVNTPITPLQLPVATSGTPPYTYTLSPIPNGLDFNAATQLLTGTPTTVGTTNATYTATDTTGLSAALNFTIEVFEDGTAEDSLDVNGDGQVDVLDLVLVAVFYGTRGNGLPADVNADGIVNVQDFAAVAAGVDAAEGLPQQVVEDLLQAAMEQAAELEAVAGAPMGSSTPRHLLASGIVYRNFTAALTDAKPLSVSNARLVKGVALLESLLELLSEMVAVPEQTALLPNYPNPFNPETWIPYHLSKDAEVMLTIYDVRGIAVRELTLGHQPAGIYESRGRAAYWDGRNQLGEHIASGVYFYTLTAGDFTATRKLIIRK